MKKGSLFIIQTVLYILLAGTCCAGVEKGLAFRSYEVSPDLRTSLEIPSGEKQLLKFHKYFTLAFDLKIDTDKECFGYVCRIIIDDRYHVDVILSNPVSGMPYLGLATASGKLEPLKFPPDARIREWNRIRIELLSGDKSICVTANGEQIAQLDAPGQSHTAAVCFGTNSRGQFATSDVAPMILRNIALSLREGEIPDYYWGLEYDGCDRSGRIGIGIKNPEWLISRNSCWRKLKEFSFASKVFQVMDPFRNRILFVTADRVTVFCPQDGGISEYPFRQDIRSELITNDFIVLPDGELVYYDLEHAAPVISRFDFRKSSWERPVERDIHSKYLHHNKFYNPVDSSIVQLFGYGFHRYLKEIASWKVAGDTVRRNTSANIQPRYLSAVGVADTVAYIYGGKGNDTGIQEFGTTIYQDFYRLDLADLTLSKLWDNPSPDMQVAASNLVVAGDGKSFTALFYSPNTYQSQLQLKEYTIADGQSRLLADTISYHFIDVDSEAALLFDRQSEVYYAITSGKKASGGYYASIYTLQAPVVDLASLPVSRSKITGYIIPGSIFLILAASILIVRKRRKRSSADVPDDGFPETAAERPEADSLPFTVEVPERKEAGIYLLGGFRVIDQQGNDITANFTPVMRQLLVLIILYSENRKGISSAELKEALWSDKSEESYYNNRGVNIRKIRTWLAKVGAIELVSTNGYWHFTEAEGGGIRHAITSPAPGTWTVSIPNRFHLKS